MRFRVLITIACVLLSSLLAMSQNQPLTQKPQTNFDFQDPIILEFQRLKSIRNTEAQQLIQQYYISLLKSIPYFEIRKYTDEINDLLLYTEKNIKKDNPLYIKVLGIKSLSSYQLRDYQLALSEFESFFKLLETLQINDSAYAFEYTKYALCFKQLKQPDQFLTTLEQGILKADKRILKENDLAIYYTESGAYFSSKRKLDTARLLLDQALSYAKNAPNRDFTIISKGYRRKAFLEVLCNNTETAISLYDQAMEALLKSDHTDIEIATIYKSKATALMSNIQFREAIKQLKMALHIYQSELDNKHTSITSTYRYIGLCYYNLGDNENAIINYQKSLEIDNSKQNYLSRRNLADAYFQINQNHKADSLYKISLNHLLITRGSGDYQTNMTYLSYGQFLLENESDIKKGKEYLKRCIQYRYKNFKGRHIDICEPLNILGAYYLNHNEVARGIDSLQSSLMCAVKEFKDIDIHKNPSENQIFNNRNLINTLAWKAYGLYRLFLISHDIRDLKSAHKTYQLYFQSTKNQRKYFNETESLFMGEEIHYVFNQAIDVAQLLYKETKDPLIIEDIFHFIEGKKSFTLLNSLNTLEQKKLLKVPKSLLNFELDLKYRMGLIAENINIEENNPNKDRDKIMTMDKEAFELSKSLDSIQGIYKNEYSGFYQLKYGFKELSLEEIKNKIPKGTAFINYSLSDSILSIMCLSKFHTNLITSPIDSTFFNQVKIMVQLLKKVDTDKSYQEFGDYIAASRYLYKKLIEPIESHIKNKDLVIIPDGIINYLPFDALLTEDVNLTRPDYRLLPYLIKKHKSNIANSMQVYFNMKVRTRNLKEKIFAFAPSYADPMITDSLPSEYQGIRPLDYAGLEAEAIGEYLPTETFLREEASEKAFMKNAKNAAVLHLAMHTIINDRNPMYSKLLFTYDDFDQSGLVNTYELLTMDLNAELAVLSGCSTGEGELKKGEGVMSLSSGFQYAGVPAIVMSLWEVNDRFGALVIDKFYFYLSKGMAKNKALHLAKIEVLAQGNALYSHPYYWAGLTLMGENEKLQFQARKKIDIYLIFSSGILLLLIFGYTYRKKWTT